MRSSQGREPVSVLDRIIAILEVVRESHGSTTITQLALATGIPKSTVSRLVGDLVRRRYLTRTDGRRRRSASGSSSSGRGRAPRAASAVAALPVLAELFNATGEHLNVAVQEGRDMLSVISVRGRLRPAPSRAGVRVPSVTTALGKAVLAFTDDESVLRGIMTDLDPGSRTPFEQELAGVRTLCGRDRPLRDVPRSDRRRQPDPVARAMPRRRDLGRRAGGRHGPRPDRRRSCGMPRWRSRTDWHCRWPDRCGRSRTPTRSECSTA